MATATKVEKTAIQMEDGRTVEFTPKQRLVKTSEIAEDGTISGRFDFRNGKSVVFVMPAELVSRFAAHGMEQKLGDAVAGEKDEGDAFEALSDLAARLTKGEWTAQRAAGGFAGTSVLIQALVKLTGKPVEAIKEFLSAKTQAEKLALRKSERLAPIIAEIEAERAKNAPKSSVDTDSLLAELGDSEPTGKKAKG